MNSPPSWVCSFIRPAAGWSGTCETTIGWLSAVVASAVAGSSASSAVSSSFAASGCAHSRGSSTSVLPEKIGFMVFPVCLDCTDRSATGGRSGDRRRSTRGALPMEPLEDNRGERGDALSGRRRRGDIGGYRRREKGILAHAGKGAGLVAVGAILLRFCITDTDDHARCRSANLDRQRIAALEIGHPACRDHGAHQQRAGKQRPHHSVLFARRGHAGAVTGQGTSPQDTISVAGEKFPTPRAGDIFGAMITIRLSMQDYPDRLLVHMEFKCLDCVPCVPTRRIRIAPDHPESLAFHGADAMCAPSPSPIGKSVREVRCHIHGANRLTAYHEPQFERGAAKVRKEANHGQED